MNYYNQIKTVKGRRYCNVRHKYLDPYIDNEGKFLYIDKYDLNHKFLQRYQSVRQACIDSYVARSTISLAHKRSNFSSEFKAKGYIWKIKRL